MRAPGRLANTGTAAVDETINRIRGATLLLVSLVGTPYRNAILHRK